MLRSVLLAGLVTIGAAFPALAGSDTTAGAAQQGCHDGAWLPGTLQIDERARPAEAEEGGQGLERSLPQTDCAYV